MSLLAIAGLVKVLASVSFFFFPGFQIATAQFRRDHSFVHLVFLAMLLSVGINSMTLYLLGLADAITFQNLSYCSLAINATLLAVFRHSVASVFAEARLPRPTIRGAPVVLIGFVWFAILLNCATWPFALWDALATFNPTALHILATGSTARFVLPGYSGSEVYFYPLGFPTSFVWAYLVSGLRTENLAHLMCPFFLLMLLGYSFLLAKQLGGSGTAAALLLALTPTVLVYTLGGYADVAAGAFFAATAFYATRWVTTTHCSRVDLVLAAMSAGLTAWMKPQGLFIAIALPTLLVLVCIIRHDRRYLLKSDLLGILLVSELSFLVIYIYTPLALGPCPSCPWLVRNAADILHYYFAGGRYGIVDHDALGSLGQRVLAALKTLFVGEVAGQSLALAGLMASGLVYSLIRRVRGRSVFPSLLCLGYAVFWMLMFGWADRYLISLFAVAAPLSSAMLADIARSSKSRRRFVVVILVVLLAEPAANGVVLSVQGYGPDLTWSLSHLGTSLDEKRDMLMGPMWRIAHYAASRPEIANSKILVTEIRMLDWLFNATSAGPPSAISRLGNTLRDECHWDYLIAQQNEVPEDVRLNLLRPVHQEGQWWLWQINCSPPPASDTSMDNLLATSRSVQQLHLLPVVPDQSGERVDHAIGGPHGKCSYFESDSNRSSAEMTDHVILCWTATTSPNITTSSSMTENLLVDSFLPADQSWRQTYEHNTTFPEASVTRYCLCTIS